MALEFRRGTPEDNDIVFKFLNEDFRITEPITTSIGATEEDVFDFFGDLRDGGLQNAQYSTLLFENSNLIGICLCDVKEYTPPSTSTTPVPFDPHQDYYKEIECGPYSSVNANRLVTFVEVIESDMRRLLGNPEKIFKIDVICVKSTHQRRGLARQLTEKSIELARQSDCQYVATCATAVGTQHLFASMGFTTIRELPFSCFRENGQPVYRHLSDSGRCGRLMALDIQDDFK